ncbi:MAG: hypothetical protein SGI71_11585 [Verrucomicrobiota bacterium]|nr:hypothetical protein [Verrucomicrobiota bacterium]
MIEFNQESLFARKVNRPRQKLVVCGVGNAGMKVIDKLVLSGITGMGLVSMNTDEMALAGTLATTKVLMGNHILHGMSAGGDPEVGNTAAQASVAEIRATLEGADAVIIVAGLGGGAGTGALSVIASQAREAGAAVIGLLSLPFSFEGKRRLFQADQGLKALQPLLDAEVVFSCDQVEPMLNHDGLRNTFAAVTDIQAQCATTLWRLLVCKGLMNLRMEEITNVLKPQQHSLFGYGESMLLEGRMEEALEKALASPLLAHRIALRQADSIILHIISGPELVIKDAQHMVESIQQELGLNVSVFTGATVDENYKGKLGIALLASTPFEKLEIKPLQVVGEASALGNEETSDIDESKSLLGTDDPISISLISAPRKGSKKIKQDVFRFEKVNKGQFEKTDPTIVDGEDLDVPTFLRKNTAMK